MKGLTPNWRIRRVATGRWMIYVRDVPRGWRQGYLSLVSRPTWQGAMDFIADVERVKLTMPSWPPS